jgi:hypothetical protein
VRTTGCEGQEDQEAFHSVSPSGLGMGRIDADGVSVSSHTTL